MRNKGRFKPQITPQDFELWGRITKATIPLREEEKNFANLLINSDIYETSSPTSKKQLQSSTSAVYQPAAPMPSLNISGPVDPNIAKKISRGKIRIDRRVDLHGLSQEQAHRILMDAVENAYYANQRTLLIITGKGNLGRGILREKVPGWLAGTPFLQWVSEVSESHISHGGSGALYVRIRKSAQLAPGYRG